MSRADHGGSVEDTAGGETNGAGRGGSALTIRRHEAEAPAGSSTDTLPRVSVAGELDAATATQLLAAVSEAITEAAGRDGLVVVDLDAVSFCDSRGLTTLVSATRSAARAGASLRLVAAPEAAVSRLLGRTGMTGLLPPHPDLPAALSADTPSPLEKEVDGDVR